MRKYSVTLFVVLALVLSFGTAFAASSKTTAAVSKIAIMDSSYEGAATATTAADTGWETILSNTIKTANPSDLIVDVSLECGLYTETNVKSKGGTKDTSNAQAGVVVQVLVDGNEMLPGEVTFCSREQELYAVFQGIFEASDDCVDSLTGIIDTQCLAEECLMVTDDDTIVIDESCLTEEEVGLFLNTMSANSFNFLIADVGVGEHTIEVQAQVTSGGTSEAGSADAYATIGKGSMTVDEVKMIKAEDNL